MAKRKGDTELRILLVALAILFAAFSIIIFYAKDILIEQLPIGVIKALGVSKFAKVGNVIKYNVYFIIL